MIRYVLVKVVLWSAVIHLTIATQNVTKNVMRITVFCLVVPTNVTRHVMEKIVQCDVQLM